MDEQLLIKLIQKAVDDETRKELYLKALPSLSAEERVKMAAGLWEMMFKKLHFLAVRKVEDMVNAMAENESVKYEKADFQAAYDEEVTRFLSEQLEVTDQDELSKLRDSLNQIGKKVEEHDQVISKLKDKI